MSFQSLSQFANISIKDLFQMIRKYVKANQIFEIFIRLTRSISFLLTLLIVTYLFILSF